MSADFQLSYEFRGPLSWLVAMAQKIGLFHVHFTVTKHPTIKDICETMLEALREIPPAPTQEP